MEVAAHLITNMGWQLHLVGFVIDLANNLAWANVFDTKYGMKNNFCVLVDYTHSLYRRLQGKK